MMMLIFNVHLTHHHLVMLKGEHPVEDLDSPGERGYSHQKKGTYTLLAHLQIQIAEENFL